MCVSWWVRLQSALVEWFVANALSPYASKEQTLQLAGQTGLTFTQVGAWLCSMLDPHLQVGVHLN